MDHCVQKSEFLFSHKNCGYNFLHHRPEADEEENYIRSFCVKREIPIFVHNDPFTYTGNFEAAARELRYRFFVEIVRREGYQGVLIGHHQDDLLESSFFAISFTVAQASFVARWLSL